MKYARVHSGPGVAGMEAENTSALDVPPATESRPKLPTAVPVMAYWLATVLMKTGFPAAAPVMFRDQPGGSAPSTPSSNEGLGSTVLMGPDMVPITNHCESWR